MLKTGIACALISLNLISFSHAGAITTVEPPPLPPPTTPPAPPFDLSSPASGIGSITIHTDPKSIGIGAAAMILDDEIITNDSAFDNSGDLNRIESLHACLLYTSPSPRDRG